jgi:iron complex outermembrane receptor protein
MNYHFDVLRGSAVNRALLCASLVLLISVPNNGYTAEVGLPLSTDLTEWSLEKLLDTKVTSVSKKEEKVSEAAAAIHVITQDDIRRSGVTTIAEALRMAPGMQVARVDSHQWAISSRGFNDVFANKLLVLIDGRSVYTPVFSGVFWDVQDTLMEDIDRIEVIRGPGATLWGANAVNGVINIITKKSRDTQGTLISGGGGTEERGFASFRHGGKLGESAAYRVYG